MQKIADLITNKKLTPDKRNTYEYQAYGNKLAEDLGDTTHRALYIKLAKSTPRNKLDAAKEFALGYENETNKGKLFMWKLSQLKLKAN